VLSEKDYLGTWFPNFFERKSSVHIMGTGFIIRGNLKSSQDCYLEEDFIFVRLNEIITKLPLQNQNELAKKRSGILNCVSLLTKVSLLLSRLERSCEQAYPSRFLIL